MRITYRLDSIFFLLFAFHLMYIDEKKIKNGDVSKEFHCGQIQC